MFALHVTKYIYKNFKLLIFLEAIMLAIAVAHGGTGPGGRYPHCELLVNISAEGMNQTNDNPILYFNKSDPVALRFELINKLKKDDYTEIRLKYNISDLYLFPLERIKATGENPSASDGLFSISFYRTKLNKDDYLEVNKKGFLDFYCKEFLPLEKIYFNFSTQISNKPKMSGEFEIAELRGDNIDFDSNRIRRDDSDDNFNIRKLNKIIINGAEYNNSITNNKNKTIDSTDLFSWDKIPGEDEKRLREVLTQRFSIDWSKGANIEKNNDNKTIKVFAEKKSISLELNDEKNKVILEIDGVKIDEFIAKMENLELKIYPRTTGKNTGYLILIVKIAIIVFLLMVYYIIVEFKLRNFKKSSAKYKYIHRAIFIFILICLVVCFVTNNYWTYLISIVLGIPGSIMATVILKYIDNPEQSNE